MLQGLIGTHVAAAPLRGHIEFSCQVVRKTNRPPRYFVFSSTKACGNWEIQKIKKRPLVTAWFCWPPRSFPGIFAGWKHSACYNRKCRGCISGWTQIALFQLLLSFRPHSLVELIYLVIQCTTRDVTTPRDWCSRITGRSHPVGNLTCLDSYLENGPLLISTPPKPIVNALEPTSECSHMIFYRSWKLGTNLVEKQNKIASNSLE